MHCASCHRQRPPGSTFCVLCGTRLIRRPEAEIREELSRVEWLLQEASRWDSTLVGAADASRLSRFYAQQADWLRLERDGAELTPARVLTHQPLPVQPDPVGRADLPTPPVSDQVAEALPPAEPPTALHTIVPSSRQ
jgi:hypothetical protein